jgi:Ca2+/Na+ antiporter
MLKAKLIENEHYYSLKRKQLVLMLLPAIPTGLIVNFYQFPIWVTILMVVIYLSIIILIVKNQKQTKKITEKRFIEIDTGAIKIISKKGVVDEVINLDEVETIFLNDEYSMSQETLKDIGNELIGKVKQNYLILLRNKHKRRLDFEVDSHYMSKRLNSLLEKWKMQGYNVERIEH